MSAPATTVPAPPETNFLPRITRSHLAAARRRASALALFHGPALAGYTLLTIFFFWPVASRPTSRLLSDGQDGAAYLWYLEEIPRALLNGNNPFWTDRIFFPVGARTAFHTGMPLISVASWPLQKLFGLGLAANLVELGAVVLSGWGAYLLAHHVARHRPAAFVAGAAFAFIPYRMGRASIHYSLNQTAFLPFGILALLRLYERPTRGRAAVFGALVGATFLTDFYYFAFLVFAAVVLALVRWRATFTRLVARRLGQSVLVATLVALPLAVPMVQEMRDDYLDPVPGWAGADVYSNDVLSWVVPSGNQRVWGDTFTRLDREVTGGERTAFPGWTVLALAAGGVVWGARGRKAPWVALFSTFFVLGLGPFLHVNGWTGAAFSRFGAPFSVPLPFYLIRSVPVLNGLRVPGRFSIVAALALGMLGALFIARLASASPRRGRLVAAACLVLIAVEFFPTTVYQTPMAVPRPYHAIADDPDGGAVLDIPMQWRSGFGAYGDFQNGEVFTTPMYYATVHGKPMVGGMAARYPKRFTDGLEADPLYRQVITLSVEPPRDEPVTFTAADLRQGGIGFIVYRRDRPRPRLEQYLTGLGLPVLADDGTVLVWKVPLSP